MKFTSVPHENLSAPREIEFAAQHAGVERLTVITGNSAKVKELAPQFVGMGERIAERGYAGVFRAR